jgi:hypothetical protein
MDGGRKPDPKPENENELTDEEIIDLTQVLEGGDDDDIIDLNEVLEQPGQAPDETDEGIIPLVDAIPAEKATTLPEDTDEAIIDLGEDGDHHGRQYLRYGTGNTPVVCRRNAAGARSG